MNGRIYDPTLGRFLQADPFIQGPRNSQSYNRYSYVLNNPLSYTDPSGYFFKSLQRKWIRSLSKVFGKSVVNFVGNIVANIVAGPIGNAYWTYEFTRAHGGSSSQALRGAFTSYVSASLGGIRSGDPVANFFIQGTIGGIMSDLNGGKFGHGFWAAGLNSAFGGTNATSNPYANVVISGVIGGTISKVTGGKFGNGAASAAFASVLRQDWGASGKSKRGYAKGLAKLSDEDRADINGKLKALQTEADKLNKAQYFKDDDHAAIWLHDKVHPLAMKYDIEFGARIFQQYGMDGQYTIVGGIITDYYHDEILDMRRSRYGSLRATSDWHSHGASSATFTYGADTSWATNNRAVSYLSIGDAQYGTIRLQKYQNNKITTMGARFGN